jgi:hypothetical protein
MKKQKSEKKRAIICLKKTARRNENEIVKQNNIFIFNKIIYSNAFVTIIHGRWWP